MAPPRVLPRTPPPRRDTLSLLAFSAVLVVEAAGLGLASAGSRPFVGTAVMGAGFVLAAVARLVAPLREAGPLAVRSRGGDVVVLTTLGLAMIVLALSLRSRA